MIKYSRILYNYKTKLIESLKDKNYNILIVEHKDRLTRFGFNYIKVLFEEQKRNIEIVNIPNNDKEDIIQDLISIIISFYSRIYGNRKYTRKTEEFINSLKQKS